MCTRRENTCKGCGPDLGAARTVTSNRAIGIKATQGYRVAQAFFFGFPKEEGHLKRCPPAGIG